MKTPRASAMASSVSTAIVCSPGAMNRCSCSNSWRVRTRREGPDAVRVKSRLQIFANRCRRPLAAGREGRPVVDVDEGWDRVGSDDDVAAENLEVERGGDVCGQRARHGVVARIRGNAVGCPTMEKIGYADSTQHPLS